MSSRPRRAMAGRRQHRASRRSRRWPPRWPTPAGRRTRLAARWQGPDPLPTTRRRNGRCPHHASTRAPDQPTFGCFSLSAHGNQWFPCLVGGKAPGRRPWNSLTRPQGALSAASQKSLRSTRRSTAGPPSNALSERAGRPRSSLSACCRRSPKAGRLQALVSQTGRACAHGQAGPAGVRLADEACESVSQADPCRCPLAGGSLRTPDSRPPPASPGQAPVRPPERTLHLSVPHGRQG